MKRFLAKKMIQSSAVKHPFLAEEAEKPHFPSDGEDTHNDSYYFTGHDQRGNCLITRLAFRADGKHEIWFEFRLQGKGTFRLSEESRSGLSSREDSPAEFTCLEPGKRWGVGFSGTMTKDGNTLQAAFEGEFTAALPIFNFSTDMHPGPMARALSREKWNRQWFRDLQRYHQTHYEQCGTLNCTLTLGGEKYTMTMRAIRDHSFGPRDWGYMVRHVWLAAALENGRFLNVSLVQYPIIREITAGYLSDSAGYVTLDKSTGLDDFFIGRSIPQTLAFEGILQNGEKFAGRYTVEEELTWEMGGSYRLTERISSFTVNGVNGRGICESGFNTMLVS